MFGFLICLLLFFLVLVCLLYFSGIAFAPAVWYGCSSLKLNSRVHPQQSSRELWMQQITLIDYNGLRTWKKTNPCNIIVSGKLQSQNFISLGWPMGKFPVNYGFCHQIWVFPVTCPINQRLDHIEFWESQTIAPKEKLRQLDEHSAALANLRVRSESQETGRSLTVTVRLLKSLIGKEYTEFDSNFNPFFRFDICKFKYLW